MKFQLDTCAWIWAIDDTSQLSKAALAALSDPANVPFGLSAISVWEVAVKVARGKLTISMPIREWMEKALAAPFIRILPLEPSISIDSTQLPAPFLKNGTEHKDPADRIITATARHHQITLITSDSVLITYPHVNTLW